jgi:hypothetical protein
MTRATIEPSAKEKDQPAGQRKSGSDLNETPAGETQIGWLTSAAVRRSGKFLAVVGVVSHIPRLAVSAAHPDFKALCPEEVL